MFKNEDGRYDFFHFHHGLYALMAVAEYAEAAQDKEAYRRVDACYRWVRQMGDPLIWLVFGSHAWFRLVREARLRIRGNP